MKRRVLLCVSVALLFCMYGMAQGGNAYSSLQCPTTGKLSPSWFKGLSGGEVSHLAAPCGVLGDIPAILDKYEMPMWTTFHGNTEWDDRQNRALCKQQTKEVMAELERVKNKLLPAQTTKECFFTLTKPLRPLRVYSYPTSMAKFPYVSVKFYAPYELKPNAEPFWPLKTIAIFISADGYAYISDSVEEGVAEKMEGNVIVSAQVDWRSAYVMNNLSQVVFVHYINDHWSLAKKNYEAMEKQATQRHNAAGQEALKHPADYLPNENGKGGKTEQMSSGKPNGTTDSSKAEPTDSQKCDENKNGGTKGNLQPHWIFILRVCPGIAHIVAPDFSRPTTPYNENPTPRKWKRTERPHYIGWFPTGHTGIFIPNAKDEEQEEDGYSEVNAIEFAFALFMTGNFDAARELITKNEELSFNTKYDKKTYFCAERTLGDKENIWIDRADKKSQEITMLRITAHQWDDDEITDFLYSLGFEWTDTKSKANDIVPSVTRVFTSDKFPVTIEFITHITAERTLKTIEFRRKY